MKYKFDHKRADIEWLTAQEVKDLDILCSMIVNSNWFPVLFNHLLNVHVADTIWGNVKLMAEWRTPITDERFVGWAEKIVYIKDFIISRWKPKQKIEQEAE